MSFEDLDFDLFESLKKRFVCEISYHTISVPFQRWTDKPRFLSSEEVSHFFSILDSRFDDSKDPIQKVKWAFDQSQILFNKVCYLTVENERLEEKVKKLQNKYDQLLTCPNYTTIDEPVLSSYSHRRPLQRISRHTFEEDIIAYFIERNRGFVEVRSSSVCDEYFRPENLLEPSDTQWFSRDQPESWVLFRFPGHLISLHSYSLSCSTGFFSTPISWTVEGSSDDISFLPVDFQIGYQGFSNAPHQTASFTCQHIGLFSSFRITQNERNSSGSFSFSLTYVKFSGMIQ